MSTTSYENILGKMWAPEGSEVNDRLHKLQQLEQMRKEREAKTLQRLREAGISDEAAKAAINSTSTGTSIRPRVSRLRSRGEDPESSETKTTRGIGLRRTMSTRTPSQEDLTSTYTYGGARPKSAGPTEPEPVESMFSSITSSLLSNSNQSRMGSRQDDAVSDYSGSVRSRIGSSDSEDSTFSYRTRPRYTQDVTDTSSGPKYESLFNRDRPDDTGRSYTRSEDTGRSYTRSYSRPEVEEQRGNMFSDIKSSLIDKPKYGGYSSSSSRRPYLNRDDKPPEEEKEFRLFDPKDFTLGGRSTRSNYLSENSNTNDYSSRYRDRSNNDYSTRYTQHVENEEEQIEEQQEEQTEEVHEHEEESEDPIHFIQRLKQGNNNDSSIQNGLHHKRMANNDYFISTIPAVPPLKRAKGDGIDPDDDQYHDVPDLIHPQEDIVTVAQDINAAFGTKSPRLSSSSTPNKQTKSEAFDFSNSKNIKEDAIDGHTDGNLVFSATSTGKSGQKVKRTSSKRKSHKPVVKTRDSKMDSSHSTPSVNINGAEHNQDESVTYEIEQYEDEDSSEDDRGKLLPVRDSLYKSGSSEWVVIDQTPGKLDRMQGFFSGKEAGTDPVITRELNGSMVRAEFDDKYSEGHDVSENRNDNEDNKVEKKGALSSLKNAFDNLVHFDSGDSRKSSTSSGTPEKDSESSQDSRKKSVTKQGKKTPVSKNKPIEKVKKAMSDKSRSSDSDNDSFRTASESESEKGSRRGSKSPATPRKNARNSTKNATNKSKDTKDSLSIEDKLAKLESMTQEKRKKSVGEIGTPKAVPSYMSGTSASKLKTSRGHEDSSKPAGDLMKDIKDLRKFVRENSQPNTPVTTPRKASFNDSSDDSHVSHKSVREVSVQTDFVDTGNTTTTVIVYVCKHCGKSGDEDVEDNVPVRPERKVKEKTNYLKANVKKVNSIDKNSLLYGAENKKSTLSKSRSSSEVSLDMKEDKKEYKSKPTTKSTGASYMKGTTSSHLKNSVNESPNLERKSSVPEVIYKTKTNDTESQKQSVLLGGKSSVVQRAKAIENASKPRGGRPELSLYRTKSSERNPSDNARSKMAKSKSTENMYMRKETKKNIETNRKQTEKSLTKTQTDKVATENEKTNSENDTKNSNQQDTNTDWYEKARKSPSHKKFDSQILAQKVDTPIVAPKPQRVEKLDLNISPLVSPRTPRSPSPYRTGTSPQTSSPTKTTPRSPSPYRTGISPQLSSPNKTTPRSPSPLPLPPSPRRQQAEEKSTNDMEEKNVESKGVFTTLNKNPFIKNDLNRKNSFKNEKGESVWERSGSRSRESSLSRSSSNLGHSKGSSDSSSLRRSNTSVGEKSSLNQLSWSDSGSTGSLRGSRSNLQGSRSSLFGSNSSLNKENDAVFTRSRTSSTNSQNAMLNLLSPKGTQMKVITGEMETDVDAAYDDFVKTESNTKPVVTDVEEHNEESVNRAHMEFAKKACKTLEFEEKKRDSSSDSTNGSQGNTPVNMDPGNSSAKTNGVDKTEMNNKQGHGKKGKKGFLKNKFFKK